MFVLDLVDAASLPRYPPRPVHLRNVSKRPQYIVHPTGVVGRLLQQRVIPRWSGRGTLRTVPVGWGVHLTVFPGETIGYSIVHTGVFDLPVSEALYRLAEPGDLAVDVGANVGYMTSILATRVRRFGRVIALEPHPSIFGVLAQNSRRWNARDGAHVEALQLAASDRSGAVTLSIDSEFDTNMGLASVRSNTGETHTESSFDVKAARLDEVVSNEAIGVLKIDVEGHELAVLSGAASLLERGAIRDIIFEDKDRHGGDIHDLLEGYGYTVFGLEHSLLCPRLVRPSATRRHEAWEGPSSLATLDPSRTTEALGRIGWQVLQGRRGGLPTSEIIRLAFG